RPDGRRIAWRSFTTQSAPATRLPFVIEDVTPRNLRVPDGDATIHANGVTGVAGVIVLVADLAPSAPAFAALLGHRGRDSSGPGAWGPRPRPPPPAGRQMDRAPRTGPGRRRGGARGARGGGSVRGPPAGARPRLILPDRGDARRAHSRGAVAAGHGRRRLPLV